MGEESMKRAKRSDAVANRVRLLDAAGLVIAEAGIDAPMHDVADRAGVGIGTLYRHFADRHALNLGLDERLVRRFNQILDDADTAYTGWDSLIAHIDGTWQMFIEWPWALAIREYAHKYRTSDPMWEVKVRRTIQRGWNEGSIRADIAWTDVIFMPTMLTGLANLDEPIRSVVYARQRDILLDGFRAEGVPRHAPGGPPLNEQTIRDYVDMPKPENES
ncbi:TetR/AcrR family transcriptional regulator (plasmid) [Coraliomargarita sp. W4R53]